MANYQAARALMGKGNSAVTRVKERPGFQIRNNTESPKKRNDPNSAASFRIFFFLKHLICFELRNSCLELPPQAEVPRPPPL